MPERTIRPDDGNDAFPTPRFYDDKLVGTMDGITKRDYFAAHAPVSDDLMAVAVAMAVEQTPYRYGQVWCRLMAEHAYRYADAMLIERAKRIPNPFPQEEEVTDGSSR